MGIARMLSAQLDPGRLERALHSAICCRSFAVARRLSNELEILFTDDGFCQEVSASQEETEDESSYVQIGHQSRPTGTMMRSHGGNSMDALLQEREELLATISQIKDDEALSPARPALIYKSGEDGLLGELCQLLEFRQEGNYWLVELLWPLGQLAEVGVERLHCAQAVDELYAQAKTRAAQTARQTSAPTPPTPPLVAEGVMATAAASCLKKPPARATRAVGEHQADTHEAFISLPGDATIARSRVASPRGRKRALESDHSFETDRSSKDKAGFEATGGDAPPRPEFPANSFDDQEGFVDRDALAAPARGDRSGDIFNDAPPATCGAASSSDSANPPPEARLSHGAGVAIRADGASNSPPPAAVPPPASASTTAASLFHDTAPGFQVVAPGGGRLVPGRTREYRQWTEAEEDRLMEGYRARGASWECIRKDFGLAHRTGTQLKDKWRTLAKTWS